MANMPHFVYKVTQIVYVICDAVNGLYPSFKQKVETGKVCLQVDLKTELFELLEQLTKISHVVVKEYLTVE